MDKLGVTALDYITNNKAKNLLKLVLQHAAGNELVKANWTPFPAVVSC